MNYDLNRLNPNDFERLIQTLLKRIIGQGTRTFGPGPDGGREATYEGSAPYPSRTNQWKGKWIFQAKFHNTYENTAGARKQVLKELEKELKKITSNFPRRCNNYIFATNVSLSSSRGSGTHDKIDQIKDKFRNKISNIDVWGYDEINRFIDQYEDIRKTYSFLVTPGDTLNALVKGTGDEGRRKHQNKDIRPIFECWQNFFVYPVRFIYGSNPECFEDFYSEIFNQIRGCDPHDEAMMHLKTGYHESAFKKYSSLKNKVIIHNRKVARYVIENEKDTKKYISDNIPKLKECGVNDQLGLNSYYVSNVITHLRNIARGAQITLNPKPERANNVDGYVLYSNGGIRLAFGSKEVISKLSSFLEGYSEPFIKEYKKVRLSLEEINRLLSDFRSSIHPLILKAKHGHLMGECEGEKIDSNVSNQ